MSTLKKTTSLIIAVEEHFATEAYLHELATIAVPAGEEPEQQFIKNFKEIPDMYRSMTDIEKRLQVMDEAGVNLSVLSLNPPGVQMFEKNRGTELASEMNDTLAGIMNSHPNRFAGLGCIASQNPEEAAREIKRIMKLPGFGGIMISSHTNGKYLDEPEFEPILSACEEEEATIYLHPRVPSPQMLEPYKKYGMMAALWGYAAEAGTHAVRLIMSGVFDRFPRLKVVLGHCGEALPYWMWRLDNMYKRTWGFGGSKIGMVKLELKPTEYLKRNFAVTTSGMDDPDVLAFCIHKLGAENIMFAVDYPYEDSIEAVNFLKSAPVNELERNLISHQNAERLFRISV